MATPFIAEIRIFAGNFAPRNNSFCNGQTIAISQNTALFSLLGTTYGGNGTTTFCLPDLRGRMPMHIGQGPGLSYRALGESGGSDTVTLLTSQMPQHNHTVAVGSASVTSSPNPLGLAPSTVADGTPYSDTAGAAMALVPSGSSSVGGGQPHNNMMPYLALNYIIATQGIFPSRN